MTRRADAARADAGLAGHPVLVPDILQGAHLLEADAGTGKTWTLSALVLRALIEREMPIERILIVTFTKAATAELSRRIRERLEQMSRWIEDHLAGRGATVADPFCDVYGAMLADPAVALRRLRVALARFDECAVQTIHGFCQRVIAEHAVSIDQPPGLEPRSDNAVVDRRLVLRWWQRHLSEAPAALLAPIRLAGVTPDALIERLRGLASRTDVIVRGADADWRERALAWSHCRDELVARLADAKGFAGFEAWLGAAEHRFGNKLRKDMRPKLLAGLQAFARWEGPMSDKAGERMREAVRRLSLSELRAIGAVGEPPGAIAEACEALQARQGLLARLLPSVAAEIWLTAQQERLAIRREAGTLGFDDLLGIVHRALAHADSGPGLAASLRQRFPIALIDECQDTDPLQWAIFQRIYPASSAASSDTAMVLVGDPKQAIYGFRGADVYAYLASRLAITRVHVLDENQRAIAPLVDAVNRVFDGENPFLLPQIGFAPAAMGRRPREAFVPAPGEHRAPFTLVRLEAGRPGAMLRQADASAMALAAMATDIETLLRSGARIGARAVRASDVAVLVNKNHQAVEVKAALAARGIGAAEISRASVLESREIDDLIRLCQAIARPADARVLDGALACALVGLDESALLDGQAGAVRRSGHEDAFYAARQRWEQHGAVAALRQLFDSLGVGARLAGLRDGERRLTNLDHAIELINGSAAARRSPSAAVRWLSQWRADPALVPEDVRELRLESNDDLVRVVTVHASKGLEYPFVWLPFAWNGREPRDPSIALLHEPAPDGSGWQAVVDLDPARDPEATRQSRTEWFAESLRTLYVALTRARYRCTVFWGAAASAQFSALAWCLLRMNPVDQVVWQGKRPVPLDDDTVRRGLDDWLARTARARSTGADGVAVVPASALLPPGPAQLTLGWDEAVSAGPEAAPLALRRLRRPPPRAREHLSFTSLVARASEQAEAAEALAAFEPTARPDHDDPQAPPDDDRVSVDGPDAATEAAVAGGDAVRPIRDRFTAGPQAGVCLHDILERADFRCPVPVPLVAERLSVAGLPTDDAAEVAQWLTDVIRWPMPGVDGLAWRLDQIEPGQQVRELDFLLSAQAVDSRAVIDAVAREFPLDLRAGQARWSGFLRGFIDLVVHAQGRWWIIDWKSNRLGDGLAAYDPSHLIRSITDHAYALQWSLYALAVHRLLALRLPDYDPDRHFGGVCYVYLRGVPDATGTVPPGHAVHAARPSGDLLRRLDRLFQGQG